MYLGVRRKYSKKENNTHPIEKIPKASKESRNAQLSSLIKKLMEKNLGLKIFENRKDHKKEIIRTSFDRKKKPVHTKENTNNDEEIVLLDEKDYLAPEYEAYISNFSNRLLIEKYISKNNERRSECLYLLLWG